MASSSNLYRSKTCGFCGYIHKKLGGSKVFSCPQCKTKLDRDINGARNILLRYLTKKGSDAGVIPGLVIPNLDFA